ncbi:MULTISPECIES: GAF domain-containing protein [Trichocoleus]|uniref:histidine kinase n=1 Tax=Trichocoleus desertorum GB2-A4 TaxID=2933944 RepID=A0ABV0J5R9_9CYAN|nr:GAF domain-containing protein [Trichocoleus sp. FACHB-46]MBD1863965.1 GAF domain-containing protein [Trichocoleus sp. FACHB-46]
MSSVSPDAPLILIVDDNKTARSLLRETMEEEGYRVAEARDGEQCLTIYARLRPDIVLLDAIMPVMDGFTCCRQLKTLPGGDRTPLLVITGLDDQASVDQAFAAGATDYITKPIHWAVLRQRVRRLLQASKAMVELHQQTEWEHLMGVISQRIRQSLNLEDILNTTVVEVRQFLQTDRVSVYRFEPDWSGTIAVESVGSEWPSVLGKNTKDPCFALTYITQYKQGHVRAVEDIYTAGIAPCHINLLAQFNVRANLVVPILQGDQLWGLLLAHHCSGPRRWQPSEIKLVERLTTQVAIAIQQSELYQQVQHLNADLECQVQERTTQLQRALEYEAMLKRITDKVRDSLDESQILETAIAELVNVLGVSCCGTSLYGGEQLCAKIPHEYMMPNTVGCRLVPKAVEFPEIYQQLHQGQYSQFCEITPASGRGRLAMLACPIFDDQGVIGDLWLFKEKYAVFNELEIRLVLQVTNQCAIAIRQARLYQSSQAQVEALEKLNRLKDEFLSTVSHELRTPMASMKMATHMLELSLQKERTKYASQSHPEGSKTTRYLQILKDECEREINLIDDLLDLQRLDAGNQSLELGVINLYNWLPVIIEPFVEQANNLQQTLQLQLPDQLPFLISDASHLERILSELLSNACKYTPAQEHITVSTVAQPETLQLTVSNSGVEIPPDEQIRIFDKFYRIPSSDPWKQPGTGLGLSLVRKLVTHLGGSIQVQSDKNLTNFIVELPLNSPLGHFDN